MKCFITKECDLCLGQYSVYFVEDDKYTFLISYKGPRSVDVSCVTLKDGVKTTEVSKDLCRNLKYAEKKIGPLVGFKKFDEFIDSHVSFEGGVTKEDLYKAMAKRL